MFLDIRTMTLVVAISNGITSIALFIISRDSAHKFKGSRIWAWGNLMQIAAFGMMAFRGQIPDFFSIVVANMLIYASSVLYFHSLLEFFKSKFPLWPLHVVGVFVLVSFIYFWAVSPNINARVVIISLTLAVNFTLSGWMIWKYRNLYQRYASIFAVSGFLFMATIFTLRAVLTFTPNFQLTQLFTQNIMQDLTFTGYFVSGLSTTVGFLLINTARLNASLQIQASYDSLTGILNRHSIIENLSFMFDQYQADPFDLTILMIDLNKFKRVNDTHGHLVGDRVLKETGKVLKNNMRGQDIVGRYGGDEFLAVLRDTGAEEALGVVERLQENVVKAYVPQLNQMIDVSFSIGTATLTAEDSNVDAFIDRADKALYAEKMRVKYMG